MTSRFFLLEQLDMCSTFDQGDKEQKRSHFRTSMNQEFSSDIMKLEDSIKYQESKIRWSVGFSKLSSRKMSELKAWVWQPTGAQVVT